MLESNYKVVELSYHSPGFSFLGIGPCDFNSSPNYKILDVSKLKAFADDKLNVAQMMTYVFDRVENIVGKRENAGHQHFHLFPQFFQTASDLGVVKRRDCVVKS